MKGNDKISLVMCIVATHKSFVLALEGKSIYFEGSQALTIHSYLGPHEKFEDIRLVGWL